jgi:hypothetical protein
MPEIALNLSLWPRQMMAYLSKATEILFGGASEGGKSHFVRVLLIVFCLGVKNLQCVLIRKKFDDILKNHVEGPTGFKALLAPLLATGKVKVTDSGVSFPNGSNIAFQHCQDERQFDSAQGVEKHILVIDEATQISERLIKFFRAWVRMPLEMRSQIPEAYRHKLPLIIYTANPIGTSAGFFRRAFVKARKPFEIDEINGFLRQYIPSRASDNLSVDQVAHKGRLADLSDEALASALDSGDWDSPVGDFFRQYNDDVHCIKDHKPAAHLFKFRTFDWGGSDPACVLWWYVSDGQEHEAQPWTPRGSLVCYREWYLCRPDDPSKGLEMRNEAIACGIIARTEEKTSGITLTDSLPFQDRGASKDGNKYKIADTFKECGVPLIKANTARVFGSKEIKSRLEGKDGFPLLYLCESCLYTREYLPAVQRDDGDPECYVEDGEATHAADCVRYACATKPIIQDKKVARTTPKPGVSLDPESILKKLKEQQHYARR